MPTSADLAGFSVTPVVSTYATAPSRTGWLVTNQAADLMLSGFGFDQTGGALQFNHPRSLATDGMRLALSDGNNNRVLIWTTLPAGNTAPDLVIGQPDFGRNAPGTGLQQLNWPGQVAITSGGKLLVADTYNDRVLVWNTFPTSSGQAASFAITAANLAWPWGVWSDGTRVAAVATGSSRVFFWSSFPTANEAASYVISGGGIGTPRTVTSDGTAFIVGDHNANATNVGNWWWTTYPTASSSLPAFFKGDPTDPNAAWLQGTFLPDGRLLMLGGRQLNIWSAMPQDAATPPSLIVTGHQFAGGDGGAVAYAGGRVYALEYNGNRISVYNSAPTTAAAQPDFTIGSPNLSTNTLTTNFIVTNAVPAVAAGRLLVSSDFDRRLLVWNALPNDNGAHPNWSYSLPFAPWDNTALDTLFAMAGQQTVAVWRGVPSAGVLPTYVLRNGTAMVTFQNLQGVAADASYFYLSDAGANKVYAWRGVPGASCAPAVTLDVPGPSRISSDGTWLAVTLTMTHRVRLYRVDQLAASASYAEVGGVGTFNLPQEGHVERGSLFVANTTSNIVHVWRDVAAAAAGQPPDVILGAATATPHPPRTGASTLFWPGTVAFDGSYVWVGEFKFSNRIVRYSVR
jgi:hypothetical protein